MAIPTYDLYGETQTGAVTGPVHVETLHVRAHVNAWNILAHRHARLSQVFFFSSGGGTAEIDGVRHTIAAPAILWLPAGCVHGFAFEPGTEGIVITAAGEAVARATEPAPALAAALGRPLLATALSGDTSRWLDRVTRRLLDESDTRLPAYEAAGHHLLGLILIAIMRATEPATGPSEHGAAARFRLFRDLVDAHFRDRWTIPHYARQLGLTPDRLHDICQTLAGRPPIDIVHDRLMVEARRALLYTGMPVAGIAHDLGFEDPAYFSRFFTRRAGMSPAAFRKRGR